MLPGSGGSPRRWFAPVLLLAGLALPWDALDRGPALPDWLIDPFGLELGFDAGLDAGLGLDLDLDLRFDLRSDPSTDRAARVEGTQLASRDPSFVALAQDLSRLLGTGSRTEQWGVLVTSLEHGDTLFALNAREPLAPASNQKLFTSAAALHLLGPDYRFPTYLLANGPIENGVLRGDLRVYGTGDPSVGGANPSRPTGAYAVFLETLQSLGIREIEGTIIGDGSFFTGDPRRPSWNPLDLDNWFAAPISGLNYHENMVSLRVEPPRFTGAPATIHTIPEGARLSIQNETGPFGPSVGNRLAVVRDDPDGAIRVVGQLTPRDREVWRALTVSDPPSYAVSVLVRTLELGGIEVRGGSRSAGSGSSAVGDITGRVRVVPALESSAASSAAASSASSSARGGAGGWQTLAVHLSPPVSELLHTVNKRSHNLFSEALLLAMGRAFDGRGSFEGGQSALLRFLVDSVGIPETELNIEDGSGLSRLNRTSAFGLVRLLDWMERSPHQAVFLASLPEAGNRRELGRMGGSPAAGNLRAKTGTIHQTSALSGIVRSLDGERLAFSIMVNGVPSTSRAKRIEDLVGIRLAGFGRSVFGSGPASGGTRPGTVSARDP